MDDCADPLEYGRREYAIEVGYIERPPPQGVEGVPSTRPVLQALQVGMLNESSMPQVEGETLSTVNQQQQS